MRAWALALLPLALGFDLEQHVDAFIDTLKHDLENFRPLVAEHTRPHQLQLHKIMQKNTEMECGACSQKGTKWLMEHAMDLMQGKCANVSASDSKRACVFGKICGFMGNHPKVALGMMFEHLRPMALTLAYCTGKGVCEKPEGNDMEEILMGGQPHEALLNSFDQIDWSNVIESAKEMAPEDEDKDDQTWDPEKETQCKKDEEAHACPFCMKRAMKKGVKMAVMKVKAMCEKTECPKMARICQFMTDNREAAFGMLVAKVEPWKFAKGFCMKQKEQHDWHHGWHQHGHHGWHHHGEGEEGKGKGKGRGHWHHFKEMKGFKGGAWGHQHDHGHEHHSHEHHWHHAEEKGFKGGVWGQIQKAKESGEHTIVV